MFALPKCLAAFARPIACLHDLLAMFAWFVAEHCHKCQTPHNELSTRWHCIISSSVIHLPVLPCFADNAGASGASGASCEVHLSSDLTAFDFKQLRVQDYQAILVNTGWEAPYQQQQQQSGVPPPQQQPGHESVGPGPSSTAAAAAVGPGVASWGYGNDAHAWHVGSSSSSSVIARLEKLPVPSLCTKGFIMIWANKEHCSGEVLL